jgi:hypothetical protein
MESEVSEQPRPVPVAVDELKDAILEMIVERFGDRHLTWEDADMALRLVAFEIKQAAMFHKPVGRS